MNEPCGARDGCCGADRHDPRFRGGRWFTDQFVGFGYLGRENGAGGAWRLARAKNFNRPLKARGGAGRFPGKDEKDAECGGVGGDNRKRGLCHVHWIHRHGATISGTHWVATCWILWGTWW